MKIVKQIGVVVVFLAILTMVNWVHRQLRATRSSETPRQTEPTPSSIANASREVTTANATLASNTRVPKIHDIVQARCGACHYENGPAPFAFSTYEDVAKRGKQIVEVIESGYMPPWLPSESDYPFANARSLPAAEKRQLVEWVQQGMSRDGFAGGEVEPIQKSKWQLGEPDLIVELPDAYELVADGPEVFWNFVLPVSTTSVAGVKQVQAAEVYPGNLRAVHHVIGQVDRTGTARRKQKALEQNGFAGMEFELAETLQGQSMLWSPGKVPSPGYTGISWPLDSQTDILLQMHMFPTGKKETVKPQVGLYFAKPLPPTAPSIFPLSMMLEAPEIDIPAGESNYEVRDEILLPVDVKLLSIYPHAHYIASSVTCVATAPDKTERTLLQIDEWDFNWQDEYRFARPVDLPHGTLISMRFTYDNSSSNVRNPNQPPKRVALGNRTTDEMGSVLLQVVTKNERERAVLDQSRWQQKLITAPLHPTANQNLGNIYEAKGEFAKARQCYQRVLQVLPDNSVAHDNLANVLSLLGDTKKADHHFARAVKFSPENPLALHHWAASLMRENRLDEAEEKLQTAISLWPEFPEANINLGKLELLRGNPDAAKQHFRNVIGFAPEYALGHFNLGTVLMGERQFAEATKSFEQAVRFDQRFVEAYNNLGISLFEQKRLGDSAMAFKRAIELDPSQENARRNLAMVKQQVDAAEQSDE